LPLGAELEDLPLAQFPARLAILHHTAQYCPHTWRAHLVGGNLDADWFQPRDRPPCRAQAGYAAARHEPDSGALNPLPLPPLYGRPADVSQRGASFLGRRSTP
jgi:hypothetical protein